MKAISIPRAAVNQDGILVKTAPDAEYEKIQMIFKLDNKLAFITNDAIKD
jgi:hypothetical protein